jgi:isoquinoline 1-oxidoreductase subunit beta
MMGFQCFNVHFRRAKRFLVAMLAIWVCLTSAVIGCVAVNPGVIRAQVDGGIGNDLAAAFDRKITLIEGRVKQGNFHNYHVLRMSEMPKVEVHIVESTEKPSGAGEPGTPVIAPALCNALFALTGTRIRSLPVRAQRNA